MIRKEDVVILNDFELSHQDDVVCNTIAYNTHNTWQSKRGFDEILADTKIGKIAEAAIKQYLKANTKENLFFAFYDDFRNDNFKKHNAVDLIVANSESGLEYAKKQINVLMSKSSKIPPNEIKLLQDAGVSLCEIKATRIPNDTRQRLRTNGEVDISKILNDDFLTYPLATRTSNTITTKDDYIAYAANKFNIEPNEVMQKEKASMLDYYLRVYVDESAKNGTDVYIIGGINKYDFANNAKIKKMIRPNKSEYAIYLATPLSNGNGISNIISELAQNNTLANKQRREQTNVQKYSP